MLVLANSLATTLELWDDNVAALASRYRILRYDQRGHGRSPVLPGPYRVEDLAEDALELLDELGLERVSFCGLSLGGAVGMALARAARAADPLLHLGPVRPAREVGRASANGPRRRARAARRRHARALVHAWIPGGAARGGGAIP
jgi:pimeloyl-ACP methyl ester carboxylesterase